MRRFFGFGAFILWTVQCVIIATTGTVRVWFAALMAAALAFVGLVEAIRGNE